MAFGIERIFCSKKDYCRFGANCEKVNPKIRENLLKTRKQPSKIEVENFISQGAGRNCI